MKYISYYGMDDNPFINAQEIKGIYEGIEFKDGYARLEYLREIKGIGLITGIPGIGKTTLLRKFRKGLNKEKYNVIYISITNIGKFEFLCMICKEMGIDTGNCYVNSLKRRIQDTIKKEKEEYGKETIIIIDNAERLTREMIMDMRYLYEFDYNDMDYTSIILCGNEELKQELSKKIYESLRQRILCIYKMGGLSKKEVKEYIETRLEMVNQRKKIFTRSAINAIANASHGIIRRINTLVNLSLMIGFESQKKEIDEEIIRLAVEENKL